MIEAIVGTKSKENILLYLTARKEGYASEIAEFYGDALYSIQKQLAKLETAGILGSKTIGRTVVYFFNTRYTFYNELKLLLDKVIRFLPEERRDMLSNIRKRPRRRKKPL